MCGIFGSKSLWTTKQFYLMNQQRGDSSAGCFCLCEDGNILIKQKQLNFDLLNCSDELKYCLGHTKSSTQTNDGFSYNNTHPFINGNWVVAHNGIISNYEELWNGFDDKDLSVDSIIIPYLLNYYEQNNLIKGEINILKSVIGKLHGTFGCWVHNLKSGNTFLFRNSSTVYLNYISGDFSSCKFQGSTLIPQGEIFKINDKVEIVASFNFNSSYFVV